MKKIMGLSFVAAMCLLLQGCSIIMASQLPASRPPEELRRGLLQSAVDGRYGAPIAAGLSEDKEEYIEQIQFVDGTSAGVKTTRIVMHALLDTCTFFLWEIPGTLIESSMDYPEYTYFVVYDSYNKVVDAIPLEEGDGQKCAALPWALPGGINLESVGGVNRYPTRDRLAPKERP